MTVCTTRISVLTRLTRVWQVRGIGSTSRRTAAYLSRVATVASGPGLARPLPPPTRPWTHMGLDLSGPHPTSADGDAWLIVFTDRFSKQVHLAAAPGNDANPLTAERIAEILFSTVVKQHGLPVVIVSDRDPECISSFGTKVFTLCGTRLRFSTAYHPQTDGAAERAIRTVVDAIRCFLDGSHEKWDTHLDAIELAFNSSQHASTGISPFEAVWFQHTSSP